MSSINSKDVIVSIIVITYNSSKYIIDTLESIKYQKFNNIELIISDDNSSDRTIEICRIWAKLNRKFFLRIKIIIAEYNSGITLNCNRGFKAATGDWVKIIAGDDILLPNCIVDNIKYVNCNINTKIVFSKVILFKKVDDKIVYLGFGPKESQIGKFNKEPKMQYSELLRNNFVWCAPSIFIKMELLRYINYYDEKYPYLEDYPMLLKCTNSNEIIHYFNIPTVLYRQSESITRNENIWINVKYFSSLKKHFKNEIEKNLKMIDRKAYYLKKIYIFKMNILIKIFYNKKTFIAKVFNRIIEIILRGQSL